MRKRPLAVAIIMPSDTSPVSEPQSQSSADSSSSKDDISTLEEQKSDVSRSAPSSQADMQDKGTIVIDLSNKHGKSITESSSFKAKNGDVLTLEITSTISGGSVDLFLFSPDKKEQGISIGNTTETQTIALSDGEWAYNCTGFFDSGRIKIVGTIA